MYTIDSYLVYINSLYRYYYNYTQSGKFQFNVFLSIYSFNDDQLQVPTLKNRGHDFCELIDLAVLALGQQYYQRCAG